MRRGPVLVAVVVALSMIPAVASALCDWRIESCQSREVIYVQVSSGTATGDFGFAPGRARMTLPDGHVGSIDADSVVTDLITLRSLSDTTAEVWENGSYVMTLDANDSASLQAFATFAANHPQATIGWWQDLKDAWNGPGPTQECNAALGHTAFWAAFTLWSGSRGDIGSVVGGLYEFRQARIEQIAVCSHN